VYSLSTGKKDERNSNHWLKVTSIVEPPEKIFVINRSLVKVLASLKAEIFFKFKIEFFMEER